MDHEDGFGVSDAELAACAFINLENLRQMAKPIGAHPVFVLAYSQLEALKVRLEKKMMEAKS